MNMARHYILCQSIQSILCLPF